MLCLCEEEQDVPAQVLVITMKRVENKANEGIRTKISMSGFVTYERRTLEFEEM